MGGERLPRRPAVHLRSETFSCSTFFIFEENKSLIKAVDIKYVQPPGLVC